MHVLVKPIVLMTFSLSLVSSWSNDDVNDSDNVTEKVNSRRFKLGLSYSSLLICQILVIFFQELNSKKLYLSLQKEKENRCFMFHVVVVE